MDIDRAIARARVYAASDPERAILALNGRVELERAGLVDYAAAVLTAGPSRDDVLYLIAELERFLNPWTEV